MVQGQSGFLYPGGNSHALASQLSLLASNPELRRRVGAEGRRHAQLHFDPQHYSTQYLESVQEKGMVSSHK